MMLLKRLHSLLAEEILILRVMNIDQVHPPCLLSGSAPVACSPRIVVDKETNRQTNRQTHRPSTVTLAAHARRGLTRATQGICGANLSEVVGTAVQQAGILKKLTLFD